VDGELLVAVDGAFVFETLQMRLHPAESRIRRLAAESPAVLALFDMLQAPDGGDLRAAPWTSRHEALTRFHGLYGGPRLSLTPGTADRSLAQAWLDEGKLEGVVAKRMDGPYAEGERSMIKVKRQRTADCVVGGFRYGRDSKLVGSLLLGLYDAEGRLNGDAGIRKIIHIDMDAFYASVEQRDDPSLERPPARGRPSGPGAAWWPPPAMRRASSGCARPCPRPRRCANARSWCSCRRASRSTRPSRARSTRSSPTTPTLIEPLSLDEAYLDVTDNRAGWPTASATAKEIRARILEETGLTASAGISYNKFIAKLASDQRKPNGQFVVPPERARPSSRPCRSAASMGSAR
jgi:hypothetical protein